MLLGDVKNLDIFVPTPGHTPSTMRQYRQSEIFWVPSKVLKAIDDRGSSSPISLWLFNLASWNVVIFHIGKSSWLYSITGWWFQPPEIYES